MKEYQKNNYENLFDLSAIPSSMHYFIVFPYQFDCEDPKKREKPPILFTYYDQQTTLFMLIQEFKTLVPEYKNVKNLNFCFIEKLSFDRFMTIKNVKKQLRTYNIDGLQLYLKIISNSEEQIKIKYQQIQTQYDDEGGIQIFIDKEYNKEKLKVIQLNFILMAQKPVQLHFGINYETKYQQLLTTICKKIQSQFIQSIKINQKDIQELRIKKSRQKIKKKRKVSSCLTLENNSIIQVYFHKKIPELKVKARQYHIKIMDLKEGENQVIKDILFDQVKNKSLATVYKEYFNKQIERSSTKLYLKIHGIFISPEENFLKLQQLLIKINKLENTTIIMFGMILSEKMCFQSYIKENVNYIQPDELYAQLELNSSQQFRILKLQQHRRDIEHICQTTKKQRAIYEPIYLYSSQIYIQNQNKSLYRSINEFLRNQFNCQTISQTSKQSFSKKWKLTFVKQLLNALEKVQTVQNKVYRGVNYLPKQKKGQVLLFKQFISTTTNINVAQKFAQKIQNKNGLKHNTIFIMHLLGQNGRKINGYNKYQQQQIILFPYTKFLIKQVYNKLEDNVLFHYYQLVQIKEQYEVLEEKEKIIIWIDDNLNEGRQVIKQIKKFQFIKFPLIFKQVQSTSQLSLLLNYHQKYFIENKQNLLFISDMQRIQNEKAVSDAGAKGLKKIIQIIKKSQINIIFYVNYIPGTSEKLQQANFFESQFQNLEILNDKYNLLKSIQKFLKRKNPKFIQKQDSSSSCQII